jgi:hypothetical protein
MAYWSILASVHLGKAEQFHSNIVAHTQVAFVHQPYKDHETVTGTAYIQFSMVSSPQAGFMFFALPMLHLWLKKELNSMV